MLATASTVCTDFAAPAVAHTLYFGCEPGAADTLDFARLVSREGGDGRLLVFEPARDALDRLVAVTLKALLFEAVLADPDRARGDPDVPLAGYLSDEFQRLVTSDPVHGEQSFLDTCRSFGAFCLLATQSVASIEHALSIGAESRATNAAAVSVLVNNTASKLMFRSTDSATADRAAELCPAHPGPPALNPRPRRVPRRARRRTGAARAAAPLRPRRRHRRRHRRVRTATRIHTRRRGR